MSREGSFSDVQNVIRNNNLSERFKLHLEIDTDVYGHCLKEENVTYLDFKTWETLYWADREHWSVLYVQPNCTYRYGLIPMYIKDEKYKNTPKSEYIYMKDGKYKYTPKSEYLHYVKFLKKRDYHKWEKFIVKLFKTGNTYTNAKEILMLSELARKRAEEKAAETHAKTQQAYEEVMQNVSEYTKKILSWGDNK